MKRAILVAMLLAVAGCGGADEGGTEPGGGGGIGVTAAWTTSAADVACVGADRKAHVELPWPTVPEDTIACTWWCARYEGRGPLTLVVFFNVRDGAWTEAAIHEGVPNCR